MGRGKRQDLTPNFAQALGPLHGPGPQVLQLAALGCLAGALGQLD